MDELEKKKERARVRSKQHYLLNKEKYSEKNKTWRNENREQYNKTSREWQLKNKEKHRKIILKTRYGISTEEIYVMIEKQRNKCCICENIFTNTKMGKACVDHNHSTGKVRGLLCGLCNTGLGFLKDDPHIIKKALDYIS